MKQSNSVPERDHEVCRWLENRTKRKDYSASIVEVEDNLREVSYRYILRQSAQFDQWAAGALNHVASDRDEVSSETALRMALLNELNTG